MIYSVYIVEHSYELDKCDETKFIGAFSSYDLAESIVKEYKKLPGFQHYTDGFYIEKYELDVPEWKEGFITIRKRKMDKFKKKKKTTR